MKRILIFMILAMGIKTSMYSQGFGYSAKEEIGNGLIKVKSGDYYGIIDNNDNVIVSIEYQDILFKEGKALLTKDDYLWGIVDSIGSIKKFNGEYKIYPQYKYVSEGFIPVSLPSKNLLASVGKWGYINCDGTPFRLSIKMKGVKSAGKKGPTLFDKVTPFVNGIASVYINKEGWKHIDTNGKERFVLNEKKPIFRSSIHKGECIIATDDGIKQYQENDKNDALVKKILSNTATLVNESKDKIEFAEGVLFIDSLRKVHKYTSGNDSIVFIEEPKKVIVREVIVSIDTLSLEEDLNISLTSKNLKANSKGKAYTEVKIKNSSNSKFEELSVVIECAGVTRNWDGELEANSEITLSLNIPAKFSTKSISRNVVVSITYKEQQIEQKLPVTINRYNPVRSR